MLAEGGQDDRAEVSAQVDESVGRVVHRALPGRRSRRRAAGEGHHSTLLYSRCRPSALAPGSLPATRHDATSHAHRYHRLPRQRERRLSEHHQPLLLRLRILPAGVDRRRLRRGAHPYSRTRVRRGHPGRRARVPRRPGRRSRVLWVWRADHAARRRARRHREPQRRGPGELRPHLPAPVRQGVQGCHPVCRTVCATRHPDDTDGRRSPRRRPRRVRGHRHGPGRRFPRPRAGCAARARPCREGGGVMADNGARILVVDDEEAILKLLRFPLEKEGYLVVTARDGEEALETFARESFDLVILDLMLPHVDGMEVCRRIRAQSIVPIIMLTAKSDEFDKVLGLEIGADDYITKDKFSLREFRSRVRAQLRRAQMSRSAEAAKKEVVKVDELEVDLLKRNVILRGAKIDLTYIEFEILKTLISHPGRVYSRQLLLQLIWGVSDYRDARTVDVHIRHLREKLESDPKDPEFIFTVRNIGYKFREF